MNDRQINQADILALLRLGNQLHALPANPIVRHENMLAELARMTGAPFGVSALLDARPADKPSLLFLVYHGFDDPDRQSRVYQCVRSMEQVSDESASLMRLLGLSKPISASTLGMNGFAVDVPRPNGNGAVSRPLGLGDSITSIMQLRREPLLSVICFHRARNDRQPFSQRDRRIVRLFHS